MSCRRIAWMSALLQRGRMTWAGALGWISSFVVFIVTFQKTGRVCCRITAREPPAAPRFIVTAGPTFGEDNPFSAIRRGDDLIPPPCPVEPGTCPRSGDFTNIWICSVHQPGQGTEIKKEYRHACQAGEQARFLAVLGVGDTSILVSSSTGGRARNAKRIATSGRSHSRREHRSGCRFDSRYR